MEPTIEVDLYSDKPFALSPALASMNFIYLSRDTPVVGQGHGMVEENSLAEIHKLYTGGEWSYRPVLTIINIVHGLMIDLRGASARGLGRNEDR